ncbi:hypothetical protein H2200_005471 [Cladophialophora chaetospira]|uniref:Uncharacterized protein n=1 Tax=Cladophialophora chaetospira TaxID=386627 RepID=A0AA39CIY6_9EURO|nr:hypothetical protein H2200_005471 [Cladophialophora chaetospira]
MATPQEIAYNQATSRPNIGDLSNKTALITGASSGLGRAIAKAYAAAGAFVVSADLNPNPPAAPMYAEAMKQSGLDTTTPTVELLNQSFPSQSSLPRAIFVHCDVTNPDSMREAVAAAVKQYGRLDIMVNNAGISAVMKSAAFQSGSQCRPHELEDDVLEKDFAVNVRGTWLGIKHAAAQFLKQEPHVSGDRGWIINICSVVGLVALPATASYSTSKGAVLQLTKATALDYAKDRVHINCINPGWIETAMLEPMMAHNGGSQAEARAAWIRGLHPWGRMAVPEDIASMAVFLAGPGASFCTGAAFVVDGGYTAQ